MKIPTGKGRNESPHGWMKCWGAGNQAQDPGPHWRAATWWQCQEKQGTHHASYPCAEASCRVTPEPSQATPTCVWGLLCPPCSDSQGNGTSLAYLVPGPDEGSPHVAASSFSSSVMLVKTVNASRRVLGPLGISSLCCVPHSPWNAVH